MPKGDVNINVGGAQAVMGDSGFLNNNQIMIGLMKPWLGSNGKVYATIYMGGDPKKPASYKTCEINRNSYNPFLQINGTLRRDEWKSLDEAVLEESRLRLGAYQDLLDNNLVYNLGNAMGTTVLEWHDSTGIIEAQMDMDGVNRGTNDRPKYQFNYLPIPIIHGDYEINSRELAASRNKGNALDATDAINCARGIAEKLENILMIDVPFSFGELDDRSRNKIYSYVNHPDRNTVSLTTLWTASAKTAAGILADVKTMKQASIDDRHHGPWILYIPTAYETVLDDDYDTVTPGTTIRDRIKKINGIKDVKVNDTLAANTLLLVQMTSDVVRVVRGMGIQNVEWKVEGQFITKYKVMTIQVPQIRSDQNGRSGIVHATLT